MIEYRSKSGKLLPWPPTDEAHDETAPICICDDCELPRFEAWADNEQRIANKGLRELVLFALGVIAFIVILSLVA